MEFKNKVALITGAGSGIGRSTAKLLAEKGAVIAAVDLDFEALKSLKDEIAQDCLIIKTNVTSVKEINEMVEKVIKEMDKIDILVNCVGGGYIPGQVGGRTIDVVEEDEWEFIINLNMKSSFFCCKAVSKYMKENKEGKIINTASVAGRDMSMTSGPHYSSSKAGVVGFTRHLAKELITYGINVNAVAPGMTMSGTRVEKGWAQKSEREKEKFLAGIPIGRMATPEEQASAIVFLASEKADYMVGATIDVNGGVYMS